MTQQYYTTSSTSPSLAAWLCCSCRCCWLALGLDQLPSVRKHAALTAYELLDHLLLRLDTGST